MKKQFIISIFAIVAGISSAFSQSKIGYVEYDKVLSLMPEIATIQEKLKVKEEGYQVNIESMKKEMADIEALVQKSPDMDPMIRDSKVRRYQTLQQEIQEFAYQAEEKLQAYQIEITKPLYDKLDAVIAEVAKEKGFDFILTNNNSGGYIVVFSKNDSDNITKLVMTKLGIKEPAPVTPTVKATESMMVKPK